MYPVNMLMHAQLLCWHCRANASSTALDSSGGPGSESRYSPGMHGARGAAAGRAYMLNSSAGTVMGNSSMLQVSQQLPHADVHAQRSGTVAGSSRGTSQSQGPSMANTQAQLESGSGSGSSGMAMREASLTALAVQQHGYALSQHRATAAAAGRTPSAGSIQGVAHGGCGDDAGSRSAGVASPQLSSGQVSVSSAVLQGLHGSPPAVAVALLAGAPALPQPAVAHHSPSMRRGSASFTYGAPGSLRGPSPLSLSTNSTTGSQGGRGGSTAQAASAGVAPTVPAVSALHGVHTGNRSFGAQSRLSSVVGQGQGSASASRTSSITSQDVMAGSHGGGGMGSPRGDSHSHSHGGSHGQHTGTAGRTSEGNSVAAVVHRVSSGMPQPGSPLVRPCP